MSSETIVVTFIAILFAFAFGYGIAESDAKNKLDFYKSESASLKQQLNKTAACSPPPDKALESLKAQAAYLTEQLKQSQSLNTRYEKRLQKAIEVYNQNTSKINHYEVQTAELSNEVDRLMDELKTAHNTIDSQNKDFQTTENSHQTVVARQAEKIEQQSNTIKSLNQQISEVTSKLSVVETELNTHLQAQRDLHKSLPKFEKAKAYTIKPTQTIFDEKSIFYNKKFVFTGVIPYMPRTFAMQYVVDNGGHCADSVNNKTDYLVVGEDTYHTNSNQKSNKIHKADEIAVSGGKVKKISYNDFLYMIDANTNILQATKEP